MPLPNYVVETNPAPEDVQYLEDRLYEFNSGVTGLKDGKLLAVFMRNAGTIVAGIAGYTWGGYCEIRQLWIEASLRGQGIGSELLAAVEAEAVRRQCTRIFVTSHSFQAPGFYVKHGFEILCEVGDQPHGHTYVLLQKALR